MEGVVKVTYTTWKVEELSIEIWNKIFHKCDKTENINLSWPINI